MIQEAIARYRGVLCLHCRQPIPLPAGVLRREAERRSGLPSPASDLGPRAFALRCKVCNGEGLYAESRFVDCEGLPRTRKQWSGRTPLLRDVTKHLSRAANG
jgi:hypothetical protein